MATSLVASGNIIRQWDEEFFMEYLRANQFSRYMGTNANALIQLNEDLTKKPGDRVSFSLVRHLKGSGVTGNTRMKGNEESLDNRSFPVEVLPLRNAVTSTKWEMQKHSLMRPETARTALRNWATDRLRDDIIDALGTFNGKSYGAASASDRNTWMTQNADRVLFGSARSNAVSGVFATAAGLVNNTAGQGKAGSGSLSMMKRLAKSANPRIRPIRVAGEKQDEEWFIVFANSWQMRDIRADTAIQQAQREAWDRGVGNPLFAGGDIIWDGMIIREIPEMDRLIVPAIGASTIALGPLFLCGAQALCVAYAQRDRSVTAEDDYEFEWGVGIECVRGIQKARFGTGASDTDTPVDHGVVTGWFASVADA